MIILAGIFIFTDSVLFLSLAAGIVTLLTACCIVVSGNPGDTGAALPPDHTPDRITKSVFTLGRNYAQVVIGFAVLAGIFIASLVWQGGHAQLYLSAAPFYAAIGFYLFSQGSTIYSLAESQRNVLLFRAADQVTKSAYLTAVAAGGHLLLGIPFSQVSFPYSEPLYRRFVSASGGFVVQLFLFYVLRIHRANHLWFKYVEQAAM